MSATNDFETSLLTIIFPNTEDAIWTALTAASDLYVSLHTSDPGETGDQDTGETAYTGYARLPVPRNEWEVTDNTATNIHTLTFPQCTASPGNAITHAGIGLSATGTGTLLMYHSLSASLTMQVGTVPIFEAGVLGTSAD